MGKRLEPLKACLRFGRLTTTGNYKIFEYKSGKAGKDECVCDCGKVTYVRRKYLYNGRTKSCGCLSDEVRILVHTKHKDCNTRLYRIWASMITRCNNPKNIHWDIYGGKGIKVCDERRDYRNFKKDMFDNYNNFVKIHGEKDTTLDRIDQNGNYCKENCRRATYSEQNLNKKNNIKYDINGKKLTLKEICDLGLCKVSYKLALGRRGNGRDINKIISTPYRYDKHRES